MSEPTVVIEATVGVGWSWEVISRYVIKEGHSLTIRRGRSSEQGRAQPGECSFTLGNADGRFTEDSTTSPYAGRWVRLRTRIRVTVNGQICFVGYLQSSRMTWPSMPSPTVIVTAVDAMAVMSASPTPDPWAPELIESLDPVLWWRLDDPAGSTRAAESVTGEHPLIFTSPATMAFGASMPDGLDSGTGLQMKPTATAYSIGDLPHSLPEPIEAPYTVVALYSRTSDPDSPLALDEGWARGLRIDGWGYAYEIYRPIGSDSMRLDVWVTDDDPDQMEQRETLAKAAPVDTPVLIALTVEEGVGTTLHVGGQSASVYRDDVPLASLQLSGAMAGEWANLAVIPRVLSGAEIASLQAKMVGGTAAPVSDWLQRATDAAGVDADVQILGYDRPMMRPTLRGSNPAAIGDALADAAGAMYVCDRVTGAARWLDHRYIVPTVHLTARMASREGVAWGSDASMYVTGATIDGKVIAQRDAWPQAHVEVSDLLPAAQRKARAHWLAHAGDVMSAARLSGIVLHLRSLEDGRTNLAVDPAATGKATSGPGRIRARNVPSNGTVAYISGSGPAGGPSTAARFTVTTAAATIGRFNLAGDSSATSPAVADLLPVTPGEVITVSVWVRSGSGGATYRLDYRPEAGGAWAGGSMLFSTAVTPAANAWVRISGSLTVPAGAEHVGLLLHQTATLAVGDTSTATGLLIERGSTVGTYGDGSMDGWAWQGLPNRGQSTYGVDTALALDLRSRIVMDSPPSQVPTGGIQIATVEGYTMTISSAQWTLDLNTAPDPRYVIGDPITDIVEGGYRRLY